MDKCEKCGSIEVGANTPRTMYECGSSDSDKREGTFKETSECFLRRISQPNNVIVCSSEMQLAYVLCWCDKNDKLVAGYMRTQIKFPFCLNVAGQIVSWTDRLDRALNYVDFIEFAKFT